MRPHTKVKWVISPEQDYHLVERLASEVDLRPIIVTILAGRGLTSAEDIDKFINPNMANLTDPFLIPGMETAVARTIQALRENETIMIYGDYDVDDTGIIMITWDNGATSIIESGWWQPHADGPEAATRLFGTKGYASIFPTLLKTAKGNSPGEYKPLMPEREEHCDQVIYTRQMEHFVDCIKKRIQPNPGFKEGLEVLKIVDAAYQSSEIGQAVDL